MQIGLKQIRNINTFKGKKLENVNKLIIALFLLMYVVVTLIVIRLIDCSNQIEFYYYGNNSATYDGNSVTVSYGTDVIKKEIKNRHVVFSLPDSRAGIDSLSVETELTEGLVGVDKIVLKKGAFTTLTIKGNDLPNYVVFSSDSEVETEAEHLWIRENGDVNYTFKSNAITDFYSSLERIPYDIASYGIIALASLCAFLIWYYYCYKNDSRAYQLLSGISLLSVVLVIGMALFSATYGHPDEDETRGSIDYYMNHWRLPDFRDPALENTFSKYGTIRVLSLSPYYFIAGKVVYIFSYTMHFTNYYRLFNVLLFITMVFCGLLFGKENIAAFLPLIATPQLWYIFSYATSDAWDFFLAYAIICEVLIKNSSIRRAIERDNLLKRDYFVLGLFGIAVAFLFMGKQIYYEALLLMASALFFVFLSLKEKKSFIRAFVISFAFFALVYGGRRLLDFSVYDGNRRELFDEVRQEHISGEISSKITFQDADVNIVDMYDTYDVGKSMFRSFVGYYGWMDYASGFWYYTAMKWLYLLFIAELILAPTQFGISLGEKIVYLSQVLLSIGLVIYHAWSVDFQPQGRYMFPVLLVIMCLLNIHDMNKERKSIMAIQIATGVLSVYSFIEYAMISLF